MAYDACEPVSGKLYGRNEKHEGAGNRFVWMNGLYLNVSWEGAFSVREAEIAYSIVRNAKMSLCFEHLCMTKKTSDSVDEPVYDARFISCYHLTRVIARLMHIVYSGFEPIEFNERIADNVDWFFLFSPFEPDGTRHGYAMSKQVEYQKDIHGRVDNYVYTTETSIPLPINPRRLSEPAPTKTMAHYYMSKTGEIFLFETIGYVRGQQFDDELAKKFAEARRRYSGVNNGQNDSILDSSEIILETMLIDEQVIPIFLYDLSD